MAQNLDVGKQMADFIAQFGEGGAIDLPDCAIGAICAQIDVETAKFLKNVNANYPQPLNKIEAEIEVVDDIKGQWYGYKVGVDATGIVHYYKGEPIQKILNIWNWGTADGKIPRTMFWGKALRKLKGKDLRATDRFYDILDKRFAGIYAKAINTGKSLYEKERYYKNNKSQYLSADELEMIKVLNHGQKLNGSIK